MNACAVPPEWVRYWRVLSVPAEAMRARFTSHVYHRHSHETYSFGVTESGAQAFACRRATHMSAAGQVMAFNPDDPHDGHAGDRAGFTYRMVHIQPEYFAELLSERGGSPPSWPLFRTPVIDDPSLATAVTRLHTALTGTATELERHEALTRTARLLLHHASPAMADDREPASGYAHIAARIRDLVHASEIHASEIHASERGSRASDLGPSADDLAAAAGCSRYAAYRAFTAVYGLTPAEYQRQLRLRAARRLLAVGVAPARAAAEAGFADQAHLTRWFRRCYGITPAAYQRAVISRREPRL